MLPTGAEPVISGVEVVLASGSPRRNRLLESVGVRLSVIPPEVSEEVDSSMSPEAVVRTLALRKASSVARHNEDALVIGADTIVVLDGTIIGKPINVAEAVATLSLLSGRSHLVYTGVALIHGSTNREAVIHVATTVLFAELTDEEIKAYVTGGSPMDKAGSYGIQEDLGAVFISGIEGDFYNVIGLPLHALYVLLKNHFPEYVSLHSRLKA